MKKLKPSKAEQRREAFSGFSKNFEKIVRSKWFHDVHKAMTGPRPENSRLGVSRMLKRRGVK